jgi:predicted alternative tryptophan synthase beta-subunit
VEYSCVFPALVVAVAEDGVVKADATDETLLRTAARAAAVVEGIVPFLIFF